MTRSQWHHFNGFIQFYRQHVVTSVLLESLTKLLLNSTTSFHFIVSHLIELTKSSQENLVWNSSILDQLKSIPYCHAIELPSLISWAALRFFWTWRSSQTHQSPIGVDWYIVYNSIEIVVVETLVVYRQKLPLKVLFSSYFSSFRSLQMRWLSIHLLNI